MNLKILCSVLGIIGTICPIFLTFLIKRRYRKKIKNLHLVNKAPEQDYYHCIFWNFKSKVCRSHFYNNTECGSDCSVAKFHSILKLLASAQHSISLCVYYVTMKQIAEELISAKERGVVVRIITDNVTVKIKSSKLRMLKNLYQIEVRCPKEKAYMHHKFAVVDGEDENLRKMVLGSLNFTLQGCTGNFEFVVITNNAYIISCYSKEFEELWGSFIDVASFSTNILLD